MQEYFLNLTDLTMKMKTEQEIVFSEQLYPFLEQKSYKKTDWDLEIKSCEQLPNMQEGGYRTAISCYQYSKDVYNIFHYIKNGLPPFAVVEIEANGTVRLLYHLEYAHLFRGGSGVFNRIGLEMIMLLHKRILLHASFVKVEGSGILFSAPSGTGKSTQANLWKKRKHAEIINGDRAALAKTKDGVMAWGIPYAGTSGIYRNERARVSGIVVLRQAKENRIWRIDSMQAFRFLYPEVTTHHWEAQFVEQVTNILLQIIDEVPVFLLECLPEEHAVELVYETFKEGGLFYGTEDA